MSAVHEWAEIEPVEDYLNSGLDFEPEPVPAKLPHPQPFIKKQPAIKKSTMVFYGGVPSQLLDALGSFRQRVQKTRSLLDLPEDWDDNGAPRFSESHWKRISSFLVNAGTVILERRQAILAMPSVTPVPDGSIDLHWKTAEGELLINVPSENGVATFYGDNFGKRKIKGTMELTEDDVPLFVWLKLAQ
jgi:hypothetical protein